MAAENEVYFPLKGDESHGFVCVRLYSNGNAMKAEATLAGPPTSNADREGLPITGEPQEVLRDVGDLAALRGLDVRIQLDGVEWDPELGSLVE